MANLLEQIGQHGADYLYKGVLADEISRTLANVGQYRTPASEASFVQKERRARHRVLRLVRQ